MAVPEETAAGVDVGVVMTRAVAATDLVVAVGAKVEVAAAVGSEAAGWVTVVVAVAAAACSLVGRSPRSRSRKRIQRGGSISRRRRIRRPCRTGIRCHTRCYSASASVVASVE